MHIICAVGEPARGGRARFSFCALSFRCLQSRELCTERDGEKRREMVKREGGGDLKTSRSTLTPHSVGDRTPLYLCLDESVGLLPGR